MSGGEQHGQRGGLLLFAGGIARGVDFSWRQHTERQQEGERRAFARGGAAAGERAAVGAQAVQTGGAGGVRQAERRCQPPYGDAGCDKEIVPFEQAGQRAVVLVCAERAAVKALAVAVARAVDAPLEDMRGRERLQVLGIGGEEQAVHCPVPEKTHVQLARVLAEQLVQAGGGGGVGIQPHLAQRAAVHQRAAAEIGHRAGQCKRFQPAAVVKRIAAHALKRLRQRDRTDGVCVVLRLRPAAGHADGKNVLPTQVRRAFAERVIPERDHRCAADLVRQAHAVVARLAAQDGNAVRYFPAGQKQLVFALDRVHGVHLPPFRFDVRF